LSPQRLVVVNLAIEHDPNRLVFVGDGLPPAGKIDDGEATKAQSKPRLEVKGRVVWPAVRDGVRHTLYLGSIDTARVQYAYKTTHGRLV
jgi:hypothetical protein